MSAPASITFVTGNPAKARELGRHLRLPVDHFRLDLPEVQSLDLAEVVTHKAREAFARVGRPVLVEDVGLTIAALGRLPGPLVKWFLAELGNDGLCGLADPDPFRRATASVMFGLYDGKEMRTFTAEVSGRIAEEPQGQTGFGWDPVFIPADHDLTWAQMDETLQAQTSMRRRALSDLQEFLTST